MVVRLEVEVDRIFLDLENPRHDPYKLEPVSDRWKRRDGADFGPAPGARREQC